MTLRSLSIVGGFVLAGTVYAAARHAGLSSPQSWTAAVTVLCMAWWVFEAVPPAATSLVPLVVFPLAGVLKEREVAAAYADPIILLFMGAFMLSKAIEHWGAHRRIAHMMMTWIGSTSGPRVVLAILLTTTLGSFWINNTAMALLMLPVALAVLERDPSKKLAVPVLLSVGYGASIGGIATPIGTAPNGVFQFNYAETTGRIIPFHEWMMLGGLVAMITMVGAWLILSWSVRSAPAIEMESEGKWTVPQKRTVAVFGLTAIAWFTREVPFGGWSEWLGANAIGDTTVAIAAAILMFLIPSGQKDGTRLLDWSTAVTIPWGVLILFGGGIAIADAFGSSGLSTLIGEAVTGIHELPTLAIIAILCLAVTFLSEVTSNTATANILMPVLAAAAKANGMDPALLMFPATLSNSLSFMMPIGTPPNAIIYGTGHVRILDMVRYGFMLNLIGAAITTLVCWKLLPYVFGVSG